MDVREVKIDGVTYEQFRDEIGCDRCGSDSAYTIEHQLETVDDEEGPGRFARLCPFCYTTHAGSILKYKFSADAEARERNKYMIQCFNVLLNAQVQGARIAGGEGREG
jgi:hypothetical protein